MFLVADLYNKYRTHLKLTLETGEIGLSRRIKYPEAKRPGLCLLGFRNKFAARRVLVFGKAELAFLNSLRKADRMESIRLVLNEDTPAVFIPSGGSRGPKEIENLCKKSNIPLFRTTLSTLDLLSKLTLILANELAPIMTCHGCLVEVFGVGVLIQGSASIGKSETALGLVEKGHSLIADDVVKIRKKEGFYLEGFCPEQIRHHMEIRGIGIINIARLHGAVRVKARSRINLVVKLQPLDKDNVATHQKKQCQIQGIKLPFHCLNLEPGVNIVSLIETIALNHKLQESKKPILL